MLKEFDLILTVLFLIYGLLCAYNALRLRRATKLFDSIVLYPGGLKKEDCRDPEGFMDFMRPRIAILGGCLLLIALIYALKLYVGIPKIASYAHIALAAAVLVWGFWLYRKAAKQFW